MLILYDPNLDQVGLYKITALFMQRQDVPPARVVKLYLLYFLKLVETIVGPDRNFLGRIRLISFEIQVDRKFNQSHSLEELYVHQVGLLSI